MAIEKKYVKSKKKFKVTFTLSAEESGGATSAALVGEFTRWMDGALPMKRDKQGNFRAVVELPGGRRYAFRYLLDGSRWENDWKADAYRYCSFAAADNSILDLTEIPSSLRVGADRG
jgi:1,4-alpha-glucan branching enzyme